MRNRQTRNDALTDEERQNPAILEVMSIVRDLDLLETTLYPLSYVLRDVKLTEVVEEVGSARGPGRGLSVRLRNELGLSESNIKAMKLRARRLRSAGEKLDDQQAKAVLTALHAAAIAYREVMGAGDNGDDQEA
ncbi:hypothetical protein ACFV42_23085 [Streptomyces solisilvae]|uniref:hypothetical protein n=1 Tax=Streptomyces malaysiensis TaxID=92644 RepID=UPI0036B0CC46